MMKKTLLLFSFVIISTNAFSQTDVKINGLYAVVGIPAIGIETRIAGQFSFNFDAVHSPWKSVSGNHFIFTQLTPEIRFYTRGNMQGFYTGISSGMHFFDLTKWNYVNKDYYQKGRGYYFGATVGYKFIFKSKWLVDLYAGGGYQNSGYRGYIKSTGEKYIGWNRSGEWVPYKVGVAVGYRFQRKK